MRPRFLLFVLHVLVVIVVCFVLFFFVWLMIVTVVLIGCRFGRIGQMIVRCAKSFPNIEIVAVNEPFSDLDYMVCHLDLL